MGFKVRNNVPPMERELIYLIHDLCVIWGFCIPPEDFEQITKKDYYQADDFAIDIVEAEGMDRDSEWVNRIAERFRIRFGIDEIYSSTFVDRVRGIKENW
jgi:predicted metal-dependent phosphoesterase TrpH